MADYLKPEFLALFRMRDPLRGLAWPSLCAWQYWDQTYEAGKSSQWGTIFPELNKPFSGKRGGCR